MQRTFEMSRAFDVLSYLSAHPVQYMQYYQLTFLFVFLHCSPVASYGGQTSNGFSTHNDAGAHASLKVTASATVGSGSRQSSATTNGSQTVETSGSENTMQNQNKTSARSHKRVLDW